MLKQILATSALVAIAVASAQPAGAADKGKFRQLVVEAPGSATPDTIIKKKVAPSFAIKPAEGIPTPTPTADAAGTGAKFIIAPGPGLPTPAGTGDGENGAKKGVQFVVAPGAGLPTPPEAGNKGKPENEPPALVKAPAGTDDPLGVADAGAADPIPPTAGKSLPLVASLPTGIDTAPASATADAVPADTGHPAAADPQAAPLTAAEPGKPAADEAPAAPAIATAAAVANPNDLYKLLTARGYGVEIVRHDEASGNLVFYVTTPASPKDADLLLVDGTYGKVIERKHIAAHGYGYGYGDQHPAPYTPHYSTSYSGEDNCEESAGY